MDTPSESVPNLNAALVGRDADLAVLRQKIAAAAAGSGSVVFIAGEAGAGKTRMAAEVARLAEKCGMPFLLGRGDSGRGEAGRDVAYGTLLEVLRGLALRGSDTQQHALRATVGELAPQLLGRLYPDEEPVLAASEEAGASLEGDDEMRQALFLVRLRGLLSDMAGEQPLVLFIDDLHEADEPTLLLLRQLALQIRTMPIVVIGAYQTDDGTPADQSRRQRLNRLVLHLCSECQAELLQLGRLSLRETRELADSCLAPADLTQDLIAQLHEMTAGSPLFVLQCLEFLRERGIVYRRRGIWRNRRVDELPLAHSMRDLVRQRLRSLPDEYQYLLSRAAVQGNRFEGLLLAAVIQRPTVETLRTLGRIERQTHVIAATDRQFQFAHGVLAQTLYGLLPSTERRRLHRRIADVLETRIPRETESLAYHLYRSDRAIRALPYLIASGRSTLAACDYLATKRFYEAALETCAFIEPEQARIRKLEVLLVLAEVDERMGEWARSAQRCREVLRLSHPEQHALMIGRALTRLASLRLHRGDPEEALQLNREALDALEPLEEASLVGEVFVRIGLSAVALSRFEEARQYFAQARRVASSADDSRLRAVIDQQFGVLAGMEGKHLEANLYHMQALRSRRRSGDGYGLCESYAGLGASQEDQDCWQEALRCYEQSVHLARQIGATDLLALGQVRQARTYVNLGEFGAADAACRAARLSMEAMGHARGMTRCDIVEGMVHRHRREYDRASELLEQARFQLKGQGDRLTLAECTREVGLLRQEQGDLDAARERLRASSALFRDVGSLEQARKTEQMLDDLPSTSA